MKSKHQKQKIDHQHLGCVVWYWAWSLNHPRWGTKQPTSHGQRHVWNGVYRYTVENLPRKLKTFQDDDEPMHLGVASFFTSPYIVPKSLKSNHLAISCPFQRKARLVSEPKSQWWILHPETVSTTVLYSGSLEFNWNGLRKANKQMCCFFFSKTLLPCIARSSPLRLPRNQLGAAKAGAGKKKIRHANGGDMAVCQNLVPL